MFAAELHRMGGDVSIEDHHAIVRGVGHLQGAPVKSTDLRAGGALVLAGIVADGETQVHRIEHIDRGYEDYVGKLASFGAGCVPPSAVGVLTLLSHRYRVQSTCPYFSVQGDVMLDSNKRRAQQTRRIARQMESSGTYGTHNATGGAPREPCRPYSKGPRNADRAQLSPIPERPTRHARAMCAKCSRAPALVSRAMSIASASRVAPMPKSCAARPP